MKFCEKEFFIEKCRDNCGLDNTYLLKPHHCSVDYLVVESPILYTIRIKFIGTFWIKTFIPTEILTQAISLLSCLLFTIQKIITETCFFPFGEMLFQFFMILFDTFKSSSRWHMFSGTWHLWQLVWRHPCLVHGVQPQLCSVGLLYLGPISSLVGLTNNPIPAKSKLLQDTVYNCNTPV